MDKNYIHDVGLVTFTVDNLDKNSIFWITNDLKIFQENIMDHVYCHWAQVW